MTDVTNADRAGWAFIALTDFVERTGVDAPDEAIGDLITDLLHLARIGGLDAQTMTNMALLMMKAEMQEDEEGDLLEVQNKLAQLFNEKA